jgi:hypothetical protein
MKAKIYSLILFVAISTTVTLLQSTTFSILGGINFQNLNGKNYMGDKLDYSLAQAIMPE